MQKGYKKMHDAFLNSTRQHILMVTNHGVHQWNVVPGLPDTGGQNVFVNQFTETLAKFGFKITILNRGGYAHPITKEQLEGLHYKDEHQRILYLQDDVPAFVPKEDMRAQIPALVNFLQDFLASEGIAIDLIISHYWDAARIGVALNTSLPVHIKHFWVPHSLGTLKKLNVSPAKWGGLRIDERIEAEKALIKDLDGIVATSSIIRQVLADDYYYTTPEIFLPPCVDTERYHPRKVTAADAIWHFLSQRSGLPAAQIRACKIITEISRTDTTKRKDVLIKAFIKARENFPDSFLAVTIDEKSSGLASELINTCSKETHVAILGSIWDILPTLYAITDIYCTPSVMEGFGMSAQEAAATQVPTVSSNLVPFVTEYLLGADVDEVRFTDDGRSIRKGKGAVVVQADDVDGFAYALELLLEDDDLRIEMGANAYRATIPYFTWDHMVGVFLQDIGVK